MNFSPSNERTSQSLIDWQIRINTSARENERNSFSNYRILASSSLAGASSITDKSISINFSLAARRTNFVKPIVPLAKLFVSSRLGPTWRNVHRANLRGILLIEYLTFFPHHYPNHFNQSIHPMLDFRPVTNVIFFDRHESIPMENNWWRCLIKTFAFSCFKDQREKSNSILLSSSRIKLFEQASELNWKTFSIWKCASYWKRIWIRFD